MSAFVVDRLPWLGVVYRRPSSWYRHDLDEPSPSIGLAVDPRTLGRFTSRRRAA